MRGLPSLRVQEVEQAVGADAERLRIRKAIAPALQMLRRSFRYMQRSDEWMALQAIDAATRKPAKGKP